MAYHTIGYVFPSLVAIILFSYLRSFFREGLRNVPGPFAARFTTLYRVLMVRDGKGVQKYKELHEKYGPVVRTGPYYVALSDPNVIPIIYGFSSKFIKSDFYKVSVPFYEDEPLDNIFSAVDPALHKALRAPTAQVYSMSNVRNYEQHVDDCTKVFLDLLKEVDGKPTDFTQHFHWYAFDVITSISYHKPLGFLNARSDLHGMIAGSDATIPYFAIIGQVPFLHPYLLGNRKVIKLLRLLNPGFPDFFGDLFLNIGREISRYDQAAQDDTRTDFLAQLRAKDNPDRVNSKRDVMNHLANNILAGSDTTSSVLRAIFYFLVKCPDSYRKLLNEIDEADEAGELSLYITYEESQKLEYLKVVIKEALRLHPPICFPLERVVPPEGVTLCGHYIPGGTIVGVMAPVMNHNKDVYGADALTFRPERWTEASPEKLKVMERSYTAFGHGSRACIGKNIAMLEISKFVPQILRHFDMEWASQSPEWSTSSYWFCKQENMVMKFTSRKRSANHI